MNLTIQQLVTFREVMRSGSISQAARVVSRTQPAVSAMIAGLEKELGFALFLREHGKLTPTPEAQFFLEECEDILSRMERTKRTLAGVARLEKGTLRIASHPAASGTFLPSVLTAFLKDKPQINVSLMMRSSALIEDMIASQQCDVGFAETPAPRASITQQDFALDNLCALPTDHPLARRAILTPKDLDGADLAMLFSEHTSYRQTAQAFAAQGCTFNRRFELRTSLPGLHFVENGLCLMICDRITANGYVQNTGRFGRLVFRPFRPVIASHVSILTPTHTPQSAIAQTFCALLADHVSRLEQDLLEKDSA